MTFTSWMAGVGTSGLDGLRSDPIPPFTGSPSPVGFSTLLQMLIALGVVVAIIRFAVPKLGAKFLRKSAVNSGSSLHVLESLNVGTHNVHILKVGERSLLVGSSAHGLVLLADLTDESPFIPLAPLLGAEEAGETEFAGVYDRLRRLGG